MLIALWDCGVVQELPCSLEKEDRGEKESRNHSHSGQTTRLFPDKLVLKGKAEPHQAQDANISTSERLDSLSLPALGQPVRDANFSFLPHTPQH